MRGYADMEGVELEVSASPPIIRGFFKTSHGLTPPGKFPDPNLCASFMDTFSIFHVHKCRPQFDSAKNSEWALYESYEYIWIFSIHQLTHWTLNSVYLSVRSSLEAIAHYFSFIRRLWHFLLSIFLFNFFFNLHVFIYLFDTLYSLSRHALNKHVLNSLSYLVGMLPCSIHKLKLS